jgi:hypothetical protein
MKEQAKSKERYLFILNVRNLKYPWLVHAIFIHTIFFEIKCAAVYISYHHSHNLLLSKA